MTATSPLPNPPLVVLDDDPTGTQALAGVPVLLAPDEPSLRALANAGAAAVHLLTNSRALQPAAAERLVAETSALARRALPAAEVVLRGDSTLRGHLLEEYRGLRAACFPDVTPVLLLVPALPAAGRVTVGGVHLLERDGTRTPLHDTEYARDPVLGYSDARLLYWAQERSRGYFAAGAGREVGLAQLRRDGGDAIAAAITHLTFAGRPAVCAPDAETAADLEAVAAGLRQVRAAGVPVVVRCGPTFVGVLSGALARGPAVTPSVTGGVLVVCGSFVTTATRQLAALEKGYPGSLIQADAAALASSDASPELGRLAGAVSSRLRRHRVAVLATPRNRPPAGDLDVQAKVAANLAGVLPLLDEPPELVIAKGGVTSAVTARVGLQARRADVIGPVAEGVGLWQVHRPGGGRLPYLVVPGNVGEDDLLARLVALVRAPAQAAG